MKLYLVHCGFYDQEVCDAIYENHANFILTAMNTEEARTKAKAIPVFKTKRMHIDGLKEIQAVDGFNINLEFDANLHNQSKIISYLHRDLATKPTPTSE